MLAFSSYADAHLHLACLAEMSVEASLRILNAVPYCAVSCAHEKNEFIEQEKRIEKITNTATSEANGIMCAQCRDAAPSVENSAYVSHAKKSVQIFCAFGMHPQLPLVENAGFMETLLQENRIVAIGEAGFDLFKQYRDDRARQETAWRISCELACTYAVPLVVHCRKALDRMFADAKLLASIPAVIFHSFTGSVQDAVSLLRRGVNAYFSFGNPLIFGDKSAIGCVQKLPIDRLLLETDAPYQTVRGEDETKLSGITRVYDAAFAIRYGAAATGHAPLTEHAAVAEQAAEFAEHIFANFKCAYAVP